MRLLYTTTLFFALSASFAQSEVDWTSHYELRLKDFQSAQTEIDSKLNTYSFTSGAVMNFSFAMSNAEFMFTKNFNSRVATVFLKNAAVIIAPDTLTARRLVNFGQYTFDLTELYSRRFRKELYDKKGVFSDASFFQPIYNDLSAQLNAEISRGMKETNIGSNEELLMARHDEVLRQIDLLADFCKECKPPK